MKPYFAVALLLAGCPLAQGQAAPAATGGGGAALSYSLRYSESASFAPYAYGNTHIIHPSGSLNYTNGKTRRPFSLDYSGGYIHTVSGQPYAEGVFQGMFLSQGFESKKWILNLSDNVNYSPQAPTTGFSGIPGTGEPIGTPTPPSSQFVLTVDTQSVSNNAAGELQHILNYSTSFIMNGEYSILRYPDANGFDTDQLTITPGFDFRLDARNSLTAQYSFSRFSYPAYDTLFQTDTALFGYSRSWNRAFRSQMSVGPQWIQQARTIPGSMGLAARAALNYEAGRDSAYVSYNHGTSGGSGYLLGAESDSVDGGLSRKLSHAFTLEMTGAYNRSNDLSGSGTIDGEFGSVQVSWQIGRHLNAFTSYMAMSQSSTARVPSNVLNGLQQTVSFGITLSNELKRAK